MIEKVLVLDDVDPVVFYGACNANMRMMKSLYPKLRILARDNVVKVMGADEDLRAFEGLFNKMIDHCVRYNALEEEDIVMLLNGTKTKEESAEHVIVYSTMGKPIKARTENQVRLVQACEHNDMVFAVGPAGTGKTYVSIAIAVRALKKKEIRKIILSRPAVEAGEKLGFLPGDMKEKIDPYLQPLYDALEEMIPPAKLQEYMDSNIIQIAPLAFMRGRTLNDAVVILDEAQNTTSSQIKMFMTRMGQNTKMIITGDCTQIDLPYSQKSGLIEAMRILGNVDGIAFVNLDKSDIVRHRLVSQIVAAYEKESQRKKQATEQNEGASCEK
ncbi:MAG: PhoH family protein [Bacteroidaceae bacterium]|nr:PhoH family protein [Prevotellaceae bacterium]MDY2850410.1 PhoH family protein [Bacteroidaceae bacterium]